MWMDGRRVGGETDSGTIECFIVGIGRRKVEEKDTKPGKAKRSNEQIDSRPQSVSCHSSIVHHIPRSPALRLRAYPIPTLHLMPTLYLPCTYPTPGPKPTARPRPNPNLSPTRTPAASQPGGHHPSQGLPYTYPRAPQNSPRLPCTYPGALRKSMAYPTPMPTLYLPYTYLTLAARLPCTYPGAADDSRVAAPLGPWPSVSPSLSLSLLGAPTPPKISANPPPPPPAYPGAPLGPSPGPLRGPPSARANRPARLGLAAALRFSAKRFCMGSRPNRLTEKRPTL